MGLWNNLRKGVKQWSEARKAARFQKYLDRLHAIDDIFKESKANIKEMFVQRNKADRAIILADEARKAGRLDEAAEMERVAKEAAEKARRLEHSIDPSYFLAYNTNESNLAFLHLYSITDPIPDQLISTSTKARTLSHSLSNATSPLRDGGAFNFHDLIASTEALRDQALKAVHVAEEVVENAHITADYAQSYTKGLGMATNATEKAALEAANKALEAAQTQLTLAQAAAVKAEEAVDAFSRMSHNPLSPETPKQIVETVEALEAAIKQSQDFIPNTADALKKSAELGEKVARETAKFQLTLGVSAVPVLGESQENQGKEGEAVWEVISETAASTAEAVVTPVVETAAPVLEAVDYVKITALNEAGSILSGGSRTDAGQLIDEAEKQSIQKGVIKPLGIVVDKGIKPSVTGIVDYVITPLTKIPGQIVNPLIKPFQSPEPQTLNLSGSDKEFIDKDLQERNFVSYQYIPDQKPVKKTNEKVWAEAAGEQCNSEDLYTPNSSQEVNMSIMK